MKWEEKFKIDYSPNGDDIDTFAQKMQAEIKLIYHLLNALRQNFPSSGDHKDTLPYQFHVDTSNGKFFIRNSADDGWSVIGEVDKDYLGITPANIGAVANDGTVRKFSSGNGENKPVDARTGDIYYDYEHRRAFYFTGTSWEVFLSLNFADLYDYEKYCVAKSEVDTNGKGKIPRLDPNTGKGNFDIAGSPAKILGYPIETANLKDGQVLVFDNAKQKFVNQPKDAIARSEISNTGEANKIVQTNGSGIANISISGSAEKISGVALDAANLVNGQFLVYDANKKKIISDTKDYLHGADVSSTGEADKIIRLGADKTVHADLDGSVSKIDNIIFNLANISEDDLLVYKSGKIIPVEKDTNAATINGISFDTENLQDRQVLIFDKKNKKLVPADKDFFTEDDVSSTGEIGKLIRVAANTKLNVNING